MAPEANKTTDIPQPATPNHKTITKKCEIPNIRVTVKGILDLTIC